MAKRRRSGDPRTISHGLPDELEATIGERIAAERESERTRPSPGVSERGGENGNPAEPVAPTQGDAQPPS